MKKAFTIVEVFIVLVIIGLLAAMAIPAFTKVRDAARQKAILEKARQEEVVKVEKQVLPPSGFTIHNGKYYLIPKKYYEEVRIDGETYFLVPIK